VQEIEGLTFIVLVETCNAHGEVSLSIVSYFLQ
jgi:hypothetical protein